MAEQAVEQQSESEAPDKQADGTPAPVSTEEPAAQGATAPDPIPAPVGAFITVRDLYSIFYDRPVPSLDMPNALAFEVEDRKQPGRALYALISKPEMLARISVMRILKGNEVSNTLQMVDWGAADWPPADRKCIIIIYFRPLGGRVMDSLSAIREKIPEHQFPKLIIKPIADALIELGQKGITHRAIRPDNLYYMDEGRQKIVLGDCCTSVAASDQPVVLESIESGMSGVYGRGSGMYADDMYSFGVTLLMLALGRNPMAGLSDDEIIDRKVKTGSYAALAGDERLPVSMIECMRGLLTDDPEQRWAVEGIDLWINGKRMTPVQAKSETHSQRAFMFAEQEFFACRPLSVQMHRHWDDAAKAINDGSLEIWVRRGLENNNLADSIAAVAKTTQAMPGDQKEANDNLVTRVLMLMDPNAPIRYRTFSTTLEGFGTSLAIAMLQKKTLQPYIDFINRDFWRYWVSSQTAYHPDHAQWEGVFKDLKNYMKDTNSGAGIERCVYELNEWLYCLSPLISSQYVLEVKSVLPALDIVSKSSNTKMWPVDRHISAFLRSRYAKGTGTQIDAMNDERPDRATTGMLSVLAIVQWRLGPDTVFGLASWVGGLMGPIINSYQNRQKRKEIEREIPKLVRKGNLPELYNFVDNPEERQRDAEGFSWAKAEYAAAEKQMFELQTGQMDRDENAQKMGRQTGAGVAVVIMLLAYAVTLIGKAF
ncbi:MAG: protein kinase family protein [Rhodospirillaceae bacterium]|nr:protein kinase family protein [Rhodospirillaceae bacterium]